MSMRAPDVYSFTIMLQVGAVEKCEGDVNSEMASLCGFSSVVEFAAAVKTSVVHVLLALWKVSARFGHLFCRNSRFPRTKTTLC